MPQEKRNPYAEPAITWAPFSVRLCMPEHYLMWAVLQRAMFDRIASCEISKQDRRSAKRFFEDRADERDSLFSFHSIAEHLDPHGDAEAFKVGIRRFLADALHAKFVGGKRRSSGMKVKAQ